MEEQDKFLDNVTIMMSNILKSCNKEKKDCVCSIRVSYLEKSLLAENKKYKTELFCDESGSEFHKNTAQLLTKINLNSK